MRSHIIITVAMILFLYCDLPSAVVAEAKPVANEDDARAGYCLTLPGKTL